MIIAGFSAYSRVLDFAKFREIADEVGAYLLVDMAHIAGLLRQVNTPVPYLMQTWLRQQHTKLCAVPAVADFACQP